VPENDEGCLDIGEIDYQIVDKRKLHGLPCSFSLPSMVDKARSRVQSCCVSYLTLLV
jgi:hypothetical protein